MDFVDELFIICSALLGDSGFIASLQDPDDYNLEYQLYCKLSGKSSICLINHTTSHREVARATIENQEYGYEEI